MRAADLDAVTIDAYGTLVTLVDPFPALHELLPGRNRVEIERAFFAEAAYYREHTVHGRDTESLTTLRENCVTVFNDTLGSSLTAEQYVGTLTFETLAGTVEALERLRSLGLSLAVVANWDVSLHERLDELGLAGYVAAVVHAAGKPKPDGILEALARLNVRPERALHVGDDDADESAARAAGVHFERAPLCAAVAKLT